MDINTHIAWQIIRGSFKISAKESPGYYELKNKPWFNEG
jgi:hypothetical protein